MTDRRGFFGYLTAMLTAPVLPSSTDIGVATGHGVAQTAYMTVGELASAAANSDALSFKKEVGIKNLSEFRKALKELSDPETFRTSEHLRRDYNSPSSEHWSCYAKSVSPAVKDRLMGEHKIKSMREYSKQRIKNQLLELVRSNGLLALGVITEEELDRLVGES